MADVRPGTSDATEDGRAVIRVADPHVASATAADASGGANPGVEVAAVDPSSVRDTGATASITKPDGADASAPVKSRPPRPVKADLDERDPGRVRLCVVTRAELPPDDLIRFVRAPDGTIVPDLARRLPGRGVWVTATRAAVAEAVKRGLFAKSLKQSTRADKILVDQVETMLAFEARQALSLANKAGLVCTGFSKVESAIEKGTVVALLAASDASVDQAAKLERKHRAIRTAAGRAVVVIDDFSSKELNLALGGPNVIHVAVSAGRLGDRVVACCRRLGRYRMRAVAEDEVAASGHSAAHMQIDETAPQRVAPGCDTDFEGNSSASLTAVVGTPVIGQIGTSDAGSIETKFDQAGTDHA